MNMRYIDDQKDLEDYNTVDINIEAEEKEQDENTDNYPNLSIKIEQAQYSIFELKRKYDKDRICIDPDFQRNLVWTNKQKSELIESVIMQIPLPLIYLAENEDGKLVVVDGRQRLTTFFQFLDNEFRLKDLKILPQINGMNFNELEESHLYSRYVTIIEDTQLVVQIIKYPTKDRVRFDIFDRVNRGGTPLNKQEMRNALYQGNATKLLDELSKMKSFKDATGGAISPKHMKDKYVILRALCFYLLWRGNILDKNKKRMEYRSDMEELLGFDKTSVSNLEMKKGVVELLQDEEYLRSLQHSVDSSVNVKKRFGKVKEKYKEIINRW